MMNSPKRKLPSCRFSLFFWEKIEKNPRARVKNFLISFELGQEEKVWRDTGNKFSLNLLFLS